MQLIIYEIIYPEPGQGRVVRHILLSFSAKLFEIMYIGNKIMLNVTFVIIFYGQCSPNSLYKRMMGVQSCKIIAFIENYAIVNMHNV